eukprot:8609608-Alexandrium_andersonii.AAC.1
MSASLVGSEMCIRDRFIVADLEGRRCGTSSTVAAMGRRPGVLRGELPVSYTHLTLPTICSV